MNLGALYEMATDVNVIAIDARPAELVNEKSLKTYELDFSDTTQLLHFVRQHEIDGVYPMNDHAIRPVALISEDQRLIGLDKKISENFLDKSLMRTIWGVHGLSQPRFRVVKDVGEALVAGEDIGYPVILKPAASGGGGRGVVRVENAKDLLDRFHESSMHNRYSDKLLIEEFIEGIESSIEIVFVNGNATVIAMSTKTRAKSNYQVATEICYPAQLGHPAISKIESLCKDAGIALGMHTGIAHFEVVTTASMEVFLIEVGGRAGGGHTFHPIASHVSGINYPRLVANLYCGNEKEVLSLLAAGVQHRAAVYSFPVTDRSGKIEEIGFHDSVSLNSVVHTEVWKSIGDSVNGLSSSLDRLGCVVTLSNSFLEAISASDNMIDNFFLRVSVE